MEQALLVAEQVVKRRERPSRAPDDVGKTRSVISLFYEQRLRRVEDRFNRATWTAVSRAKRAAVARRLVVSPHRQSGQAQFVEQPLPASTRDSRLGDLLDRVRSVAPEAGIRSNVIVGFPGESEADFATLCDFAAAARLDVLGVFGYSDEEGTEAATLDGKLPDEVIAERLETMARLAEEVSAQRAEDRIGERVQVLVEQPDGRTGRAVHQGPEVDGSTRLKGRRHEPGSLVRATVTAADGIDLVASEAP